MNKIIKLNKTEYFCAFIQFKNKKVLESVLVDSIDILNYIDSKLWNQLQRLINVSKLGELL